MTAFNSGFLGFPKPGNKDRVLAGPVVNMAGAASVDLALPPDFLEHEVHVIGAIPGTGAVTAQLRVSFDGGATFDAGGTDYDNIQHLVDTAVVVHSVNGGAGSRLALSVNADVASATGVFNSVVRMFNARTQDFVKNFAIDSNYARTGSGEIARVVGAGRRSGVSLPITHVRFMFGSGVIASGFIAVEGRLRA